MVHLERVRFLVEKYLEEVSPRTKDGILRDYSEYLEELCSMLSKTFEKEERVYEYLDYVAEDMANFNKKLRAEGSGIVPYSKIIIFASKSTRLDSFLFTIEMEKRIDSKKGEVGMAGRKAGEDNSDDSVISVQHRGNDYDLLEARDGMMFFFSPSTSKVLVQMLSGRVVFHSEYRKKCLEKGVKYITRLEIHKSVRKIENRTVVMINFNNMMRHKIHKARNKIYHEGRKNKKSGLGA